jgi:hypothetical protein
MKSMETTVYRPGGMVENVSFQLNEGVIVAPHTIFAPEIMNLMSVSKVE